MDNSQLMTCRKAFEDTANEAIAICRQYAEKKPELKALAEKFEKHAKERLGDFNIKIMAGTSLKACLPCSIA